MGMKTIIVDDERIARARLRRLLGHEPGRKALVVFSDGEDQGSHVALEDVERKLQASDVTLYIIAQGRGISQEYLKKTMQREGIFREMKLRNYYEKPSERRVREKAEAVRRARKLARKRAQREGLLPGKAVTKPAPGGRP